MKNKFICVSEVKSTKASIFYGVLFLTISAVAVFYVTYVLRSGPEPDINYYMVAGVIIAPTFLTGGLGYFYTSRFYFDLNLTRYKQIDGYGPFASGKWKNIGKIEYVSVFRQFYANPERENDKDIAIAYDVNLWYDENRYVTLTSYNDKHSAFEFAKKLTAELNINLLDSTSPNDYKWVKL